MIQVIPTFVVKMVRVIGSSACDPSSIPALSRCRLVNFYSSLFERCQEWGRVACQTGSNSYCWLIGLYSGNSVEYLPSYCYKIRSLSDESKTGRVVIVDLPMTICIHVPSLPQTSRNAYLHHMLTWYVILIFTTSTAVPAYPA